MASTAPPPPQQEQQASGGGGSVAKPGMRKPVFVRVDQLKPGTNGHTLIVKVVTANTVLQKKGRNSQLLSRGSAGQTRISECLVGDDTGSILFTARNDQDDEVVVKGSFGNCYLWVDLMKPGATVILRNAKIDMFKGSMRLAVDKWGRIEVTEPAKFVVKEDNNLSLVEYELVNVVEE
ncbi:hypothetical protein TEA_005553 [Camellia sinensis var. sinensis]|uniref:Single-stranded DNA binding protein Ssb-like OB fold domain-containing protein n=1 Tax=Camellia sinensis var. sinensis TaxID=542762 RepID=A0A4S4F0A1_CAMSN|nr:hypothetical protein TEA_005553 [Camellia sinensis var. sinensis]